MDLVLVRLVMIGLGTKKFLEGDPTGLRDAWFASCREGTCMGSDICDTTVKV